MHFYSLTADIIIAMVKHPLLFVFCGAAILFVKFSSGIKPSKWFPLSFFTIKTDLFSLYCYHFFYCFASNSVKAVAFNGYPVR